MKKIFTTLLLIISCLSFAQTTLTSELSKLPYSQKDYQLKHGKAKKIEVTEKKFNQNEVNVKEWIYSPLSDTLMTGILYDGDNSFSFNFTFDKEKRVVKYFENILNHFMDYNQFLVIIEIAYEKNKEIWSHYGIHQYLKEKVFITYDSLKLPVQILKLDKLNQIITSESAEYNHDKKQFNYKIFDEKGTLLSHQKCYFNKDFIMSKNPNGDITQFYWPLGPENSKHIIEYKYDKMGNWVEKKETSVINGIGNLLSKTKRKIKYLK